MHALSCFVAGRRIESTQLIKIHNPFDGTLAGTVGMVSRTDTEAAIAAARGFKSTPTRHERSCILESARLALDARAEEFARLITSESGLCLHDSRHEVARALDVLRFSAMEALRDDGQIFACDVSPHGTSRKIFTTREPLSCAVCITPFNHPLSQVTHKLAPAIAVGTPVILKPCEKTPLSALRFAELLYEVGLPGPMLSVILGSRSDVTEALVVDPQVELVSFAGSVEVGKRIASNAGYKRLVLELGGNDPLIVLEDADMDLAVHLAAEGCYRNSGQRSTAVKRLLVHERVLEEFTRRLVARTRDYVCGDPFDEKTRVGTVIDEDAALYLDTVLKEALAAGARVLIGGERRGALFSPTVIGDVPQFCRLVDCESFGPLAPIVKIGSLEEAIEVANGTTFGLSAGVVTRSLEVAMRVIRSLNCGTVNINEVPGFRVESSPFGGIKDSGLGIKEGVAEAVKSFSQVKTFSLPW